MSTGKYPKTESVEAEICGHRLGPSNYCIQPPGHGPHNMPVLVIELPLENGSGFTRERVSIAETLAAFAVQYAGGEHKLTEVGDRYSFSTFLTAEVKEQ